MRCCGPPQQALSLLPDSSCGGSPPLRPESFVTDAQSSEVRPEPLALRPQLHEGSFGFAPNASVPEGLGRSGVITTPHGIIRTPAFVAVGTLATVKAVLPENLAALGAQALLANAYHLYLQPGADIVEEAGGIGAFMNWRGPTFTDSGGFQVLSLGAGFKKVLAMRTAGLEDDDVIAEGKSRLAQVDDDGVTFTSHLDGS